MQRIIIAICFVILAALLGIGCSGEGVFENPDSIKVTTLDAIHGRTGHLVNINIGPNKSVAQDSAKVTKQVVLVLQDAEVSPATIYLVIETRSTNIGKMIDLMRNATAVSIVPNLPENTPPWTRLVLTFGDGSGDSFAGYLRVTAPTETAYLSLRGTVTQERRNWFLTEVRKPPKAVDTAPATVAEIAYYKDSNFTMPLIDTVMVGDTIYTKVVFSKNVPIVFADNEDAQPSISSSVSRIREQLQVTYFVPHQPIEFQYRMKPWDVREEHLRSGDAKPYQNTENTFICKYVVQTEDIGEVFQTYIGQHETLGDYLWVKFFNHADYTNETLEGLGETITDWNPDDFVGQIYVPSIGDGHKIHFEKQLPGASVTIMSGLRSGEHTITDSNGRYRFPNVDGDELHIRVEKEYFEPKEVIVHRSRPTTLPNESIAIHRENDGPQEKPGNILLGQAWPNEVRFILEEMLVPPDVLYCEGSTTQEGYPDIGGEYLHAERLVIIYSDKYLLPSRDQTSWSSLLSAFAHEIVHAHQFLTISAARDWVNTPEGKAFLVAREKDLAEVGEVWYDGPGHFDTPLENAAETGARYWSANRWGGNIYWEETFPNRYRWAEKWLKKK